MVGHVPGRGQRTAASLDLNGSCERATQRNPLLMLDVCTQRPAQRECSAVGGGAGCVDVHLQTVWICNPARQIHTVTAAVPQIQTAPGVMDPLTTL